MYLNLKNGNHQTRKKSQTRGDKVLGRTRHIEENPYNPRSNGQVRKQMATLKNQLSAYVKEHHDNGDEHFAGRW